MRIILTGGGTGGHIYPALAFAKYLKTVESDLEILYIGTERGLESKIVPAAGYDFKTIDIQGIRRSLSPQNFITIWKYLRSTAVAKKLIQEFNADVVIGTGGYVCAPVVNAAIKLGIPTLLHEQNAVPGVANKHLASGVTKIAVAFHHAKQYFPKDKVVFTGNPRAQEVADIAPSDIIKSFGLDPNKRTVVIFGGSRGALTINEAVVKALPQLAQQNYQVIYASGDIYYEDYRAEFEKYSDKGNLIVRPYLSNLAEILSSVDLIVARSGATTIAEVTALGLPAIFIPSPNVTNDQQTKNALELVESGAALLLKDSELSADKLIEQIGEVLQDTLKYSDMQAASRKAGVPDASKRLYQIIKEITNK